MARRSIKIANPDGSSTITFQVSDLTLPDPFPEINIENLNKSYQMRRESTGPGKRIWRSPGNDINHGEISFSVPRLDGTKVSTLKAMFNNIPNVVALSIDSGTTAYYAIFKDRGLTFEPYKNNENPFTGTAYFIRANISLAILSEATVTFS